MQSPHKEPQDLQHVTPIINYKKWAVFLSILAFFTSIEETGGPELIRTIEETSERTLKNITQPIAQKLLEAIK